MRWLTISQLLWTITLCLCQISQQREYDIIIVGGGVAGLVLADKLSEDPSNLTILLLEAGPDPGDDESITTPVFAQQLWGSRYSWNFTEVPQAALGGATPSLDQGHVLGGSSAINVMAYCRGAKSVFDEWAAVAGLPLLAWDRLVEKFRASANLFVPDPLPYRQPIDRSMYSADGPVFASYERPDRLSQLEPDFWNAWLNDPRQPAVEADLTSGAGIGLVKGGPHAVRNSNGTRSYAWLAYGSRAAGKPNVNILHSSRVVKINFDESGSEAPRAVGVDYVSSDGDIATAVAAKEVVVSAGAINSPRLLLLSGIGPQDHLEQVGVRVVKDSPEVGSNLFDHHRLVNVMQVPPEIITAASLSNETLLAAFEEQYEKTGGGPLSQPGPQSSTFLTERIPDDILRSFEPEANVSFHLSLPKDRPFLAYQYAGSSFLPQFADLNAVTAFVALVQPEASGTVRLNSPNWRDDPLIDSNYYGSSADKAIIRYGFERLLNITRSEALSRINTGELFPGPNLTLDDVFRQGAQSYHHPVGTVSMGKVLDSEFRVKGVDGLRVIDSSTMPVITTCHLQSSVYALAGTAAEIIKAGFKS
ncbi:hypothetical protein MGN70_008834 [Eutypa lata]|nr:hypothetical protein MGN70_008834 [Eutypa lata]